MRKWISDIFRIKDSGFTQDFGFDETKGRRVSTGRGPTWGHMTCIAGDGDGVIMEILLVRHLCIFKKSVFDFTLQYGLTSPHPDGSYRIRTNQDALGPYGNPVPDNPAICETH